MLLSRNIPNMTRSKDFGFIVRLYIDFKVPADKLAEFRKRISDYPKINPAVFTGSQTYSISTRYSPLIALLPCDDKLSGRGTLVKFRFVAGRLDEGRLLAGPPPPSSPTLSADSYLHRFDP